MHEVKKMLWLSYGFAKFTWFRILGYLVKAVKCIVETFSARDYLYEGTSADVFDEVAARETKMLRHRTKAYKWVPCTISGRFCSLCFMAFSNYLASFLHFLVLCALN